MGSYRQREMVTEGNRQIWCIAFNLVSLQHQSLFATVSGSRASIYSCEPDGSIRLVQAYVDADEDEEFYACKWSVDEEANSAILVAAGRNGIMRVLNVSSVTLSWTAQGHGEPINDIAVHALRPNIVLTASRDQSMRLWNIKTKVCVALINGEGSHRNEILSIDFHPTDVDKFVSSDMDNTVKIWSLKDIKHKLAESSTWVPGSKAFAGGIVSRPLFSSHKVHTGYIDCVRWLGDCIISKSVTNRIICWKPEANVQAASKGHIHFVQEYVMEDANMWFIRFSMDFHCRLLACGSVTGKIFVWDLDAQTSQPKFKMKRPTSEKSASVVRQTALSLDGSILLACCDDGTIWRYDAANGGSNKETSAGRTNSSGKR